MESNEPTIVLKYNAPVHSIIVIPNNNDNIIDVKLDHMSFINGNSKFLQMSNSKNARPGNNHYLISCEKKCSSWRGHYTCNPRTLKISKKNNESYKIIIEFQSCMQSSFVKCRLKEPTIPTNNYPLTKIDEQHFIEGYWFENKSIYPSEDYPWPLVTDIEVNKEFIKNFKTICEVCERIYCHGPSYCRLCDKHNMNSEYKITFNDITFTFPFGLLHYYIDHNVQPSDEFYNFIMCYSQSKEMEQKISDFESIKIQGSEDNSILN